MNPTKFLFVSGMLICLCGCASAAKMQNMAYTGPTAQQKVYASGLQREVKMGFVGGGSETSALWTSQIGTEEFSGAVRQSLSEQGLFSETGRYELTVMLLRIDQPLVGLDMTVSTTVQYILKDSANDEVVLDRTVITPHTATMGDALIGATRLRLANEGSARSNIEGLLEELSKLDIGPEDVSMSKLMPGVGSGT